MPLLPRWQLRRQCSLHRTDAATVRITFRSTLPQNQVLEGSTFNLYVKFWDDSSDAWVASAPTTIRYRIMDGPSAGVITDWTTVAPASAVTISITPAANAILDQSLDVESKELVVQIDAGLTTQYGSSYRWMVKNTSAI